MKAYLIGKNKVGKRFAVVRNRDSNKWSSKPNLFGVFAECANYAPHVRGGIAKTWRLDQEDLQLEDAIKLFERRVAGKERP